MCVISVDLLKNMIYVWINNWMTTATKCINKLLPLRKETKKRPFYMHPKQLLTNDKQLTFVFYRIFVFFFF